MTVEQLLYPRFEVLETWPGSSDGIKGTIITCDKISKQKFFKDTIYGRDLSGLCWDFDQLKKYPHLFRPMDWWEKREASDMPMYIKFKDSTTVIKPYKWSKKHDYIIGRNNDYIYTREFIPATKEEFLPQ